MHHVNPNHIEEVSSDEEEIEVPVMSVPLALSSLLPIQTLGTLLSDVPPALPSPQVVLLAKLLVHAPTL